MTVLPAPLRLLLALILATAAYSDWRFRRIPNWLTVSGLATGLALQVYLSGATGLTASLGGFATALAVTLPLFAIRGLGGGDVKLMAAAGAIAGTMNFIYLFLINAILGGIAALGLAIVKGRLARTIRNIGVILKSLGQGQAPHESDPNLDIAGEKALTIPRGVIFAIAAALLMAAGRL